ncbi:hypothetical protein ACXZ9C_11410 [Streptococcus agalactiae]
MCRRRRRRSSSASVGGRRRGRRGRSVVGVRDVVSIRGGVACVTS